MNVAYNDEQLESYLKHATQVSRENPVVISQFILGAREIEVDGVCDGENVFLGAIIEHIEDAGVHSGDATMVIPSLNLGENLQEEIKSVSRKIARGLDIKGPFNIQYLVKDDEVNVIECNLRSSRSMPFVSKITGSNLMEYAADAIMGGKIQDGDATTDLYGVKSPQFSFMRLEGSEPLTGVEMVSTGEVACFGNSFSEAFLTSLIASGLKMPKGDASVLISVGGKKDLGVKIAEKFSGSYSIIATEGTAKAIRASDISCGEVYKISDGKEPNVLDVIENGRVGLIVNTPSPGNLQAESDGYLMRRKAVEFGVPMITNLELADALADIITEHRVISSILAWAQGD
jgi:carbamoyl-phosphate synthase large subunit